MATVGLGEADITHTRSTLSRRHCSTPAAVSNPQEAAVAYGSAHGSNWSQAASRHQSALSRRPPFGPPKALN
jgi:hypothetical protein